MDAGTGRLVVVSVIQASVQDTSSSFNAIETVDGGSVVLQDSWSNIKLKSKTTIFPDIMSPLNNC